MSFRPHPHRRIRVDSKQFPYFCLLLLCKWRRIKDIQEHMLISLRTPDATSSTTVSKAYSYQNWGTWRRDITGPELNLSRWTTIWITSYWRLSMYEKSPRHNALGSISLIVWGGTFHFVAIRTTRNSFKTSNPDRWKKNAQGQCTCFLYDQLTASWRRLGPS